MSVQGQGKVRTPAPQCGPYLSLRLLLLLPGYLQWLETRRVAGYCRCAHRTSQAKTTAVSHSETLQLDRTVSWNPQMRVHRPTY
jgi:hypothetical protein